MKTVNKYYYILSMAILLICHTCGYATTTSMEEKIQKTLPFIEKNISVLVSKTNGIVLGNPQGKVTLIDFYDSQCPHCRDISSYIDTLIKNNPDLRVVLRELPILGYYSKQSALATLAAYDLDDKKFPKFYHLLLTAPTPFNNDAIKIAAEAAGYNYTQLHKAMNNIKYQTTLDVTRSLAQTILKNSFHYIMTPIVIITPTNVTAENKSAITLIVGQTNSATPLQQGIDKAKAKVLSK